MEFTKISDNKFQCLLYEEDLEDNNISIDDFFRNDTDKIHSLLSVVIAEAEKEIGVVLDGNMMSLQLAPQPNHSLLLTVSSGQEEFGDIFRKASEMATKKSDILEELFGALTDKSKTAKKTNSNVIKQGEGSEAAVPPSFTGMMEDEVGFAVDIEGNPIDNDFAIVHFASLEVLEEYAAIARKTWGVNNYLYRDAAEEDVYLILERGRCSARRFQLMANDMMEYGEFVPYSKERLSYIKEHFRLIIKENALNTIKKYVE